MSNIDGLQYAAQFELQSLVLVGAGGQQVDLRAIMYELNIFEDVFSNCMSGNLYVNDTQNLINLLPIVGAEHLVVTVVKPSTNWKIEKVFRVYKISDRNKSTAASEDYMLHFCSEEMILNEAIKISNSYKELTISSIVKDITQNYLKIDSKKFPSSELTSTTGNFSVTPTFWSPFYAINWLARMARTGNSTSASFVFFEDSEGFHFNSLENLSKQEPLQDINFMPLNLAGESREKSNVSDTEQRLQAAESYELVRSPNLMWGLSGGQYAGKLLRVNILDQQIKVSTLNGVNFFKRTKHTNENHFLQTGDNRTSTPFIESNDAFYRVMVDNNRPENWVLQRNAYLTGLHGFQLKVSMSGSMLLRAGQVVKVNFPASTLGTKEKKPMDELYSGNYLITAIRHKIDRVRYASILELAKDSLAKPLPAPLDNNPTMKNLRNV